MTLVLRELVTRLGAFADGALTGAELNAWLDAILATDPLGVGEHAASDWDDAPDETRLFWRVVYLFERDAGADTAEARHRARRIVGCLERTACAATTLELLPLVEDQERFGMVVRKHAAGVISRTGFLSMVAESGYPAHVKLWLEHASPSALLALAELLQASDYERVARALERAPER